MLQKESKIEHKTKSADEALSSLMRQCARAERSSGDAMRLMARWGIKADERQKILQRLIKERFIDDRRYAEAFIREKINLSAWGEYKIRATLRTKGIAENIINDALSEAEGVCDTSRLEERLMRKLKSLKSGTPYQIKTKLIRHGLSLGYPTDSVVECAERVMSKQNIDTECEAEDIF